MEYYLVRMRYKIGILEDESTLMQLVKASSKDNASDKVRRVARKDGGSELEIFEIRVMDTLIAH